MWTRGTRRYSVYVHAMQPCARCTTRTRTHARTRRVACTNASVPRRHATVLLAPCVQYLTRGNPPVNVVVNVSTDQLGFPSASGSWPIVGINITFGLAVQEDPFFLDAGACCGCAVVVGAGYTTAVVSVCVTDGQCLALC